MLTNSEYPMKSKDDYFDKEDGFNNTDFPHSSNCNMCGKKYELPTSDQCFLGEYAIGYCKKCSKGFHKEINED